MSDIIYGARKVANFRSLAQVPHPAGIANSAKRASTLFSYIYSGPRNAEFFNLPVFNTLFGLWKTLRVFWDFEALKSFYLICFHKVIAILC